MVHAPIIPQPAQPVSTGDICFVRLNMGEHGGHAHFSSRSAALLQRDCDLALQDLLGASVFRPLGGDLGPYALFLSVEDNRLVFRIQNALGADLPMLVLSLKPYSRLIKDYFMIVESFEEAMRAGGPSRLEAIDAGRRGLHNEGAQLMLERLEGKITLDHDTARRLFTLICVLSSGMAHGQR